MTKDDLRAYREQKRELAVLREELEELTESMQAPGSNLDGMPHAPGRGDAMERAVARKIELEEMYAAKMEALCDAITRVENAIENLPPREKTVLRAYYIRGLKWEEVCVVTHYSWKHVHRIHASALRELEKMT